jgi:hypothetical protein
VVYVCLTIEYAVVFKWVLQVILMRDVYPDFNIITFYKNHPLLHLLLPNQVTRLTTKGEEKESFTTSKFGINIFNKNNMKTI